MEGRGEAELLVCVAVLGAEFQLDAAVLGEADCVAEPELVAGPGLGAVQHQAHAALAPGLQ